MATELANYFLAEGDEQELSADLRARFPALGFVDDQLWPSASPPVRDEVSACSSNLVYLWWRDLVPNLPCTQQSDGRFRGPTTGCVLQFPRCRVRGGTMLMGQMRVYIEAYESPLRTAVQEVFRMLRKKYPSPVARYIIGPHAASLALRGTKLMVNAQTSLT